LALICPLCNGLYRQEPSCPVCGGSLSDSGLLENFTESYRPYLDRTILEQNDGLPNSNSQCLHLFTCTDCGFDQRRTIKRIEI